MGYFLPIWGYFPPSIRRPGPRGKGGFRGRVDEPAKQDAKRRAINR
jgi:hypothetical protein